MNRNDLIKKLAIYNDNYSREELDTFENSIFTEKVSRKRRAELELARLRTELGRLEDSSAESYEEYLQISKLLQVADFDPSVLEDIYRRLVRLQMENGLSIRLYSAIPSLQEEVEQMQLIKGNDGKVK